MEKKPTIPTTVRIEKLGQVRNKAIRIERTLRDDKAIFFRLVGRGDGVEDIVVTCHICLNDLLSAYSKTAEKTILRNLVSDIERVQGNLYLTTELNQAISVGYSEVIGFIKARLNEVEKKCHLDYTIHCIQKTKQRSKP